MSRIRERDFSDYADRAVVSFPLTFVTSDGESARVSSIASWEEELLDSRSVTVEVDDAGVNKQNGKDQSILK